MSRSHSIARALAAALFVLLSSATLASQRTWTVDPGGQADFKRISDAVAAASPRDRILVGPGTYAEEPTITKGLTVLGYEAVVDGFVVRSLQSGARVLLSGFHLTTGNRILLEKNNGHVALSGCSAHSFFFEVPRIVAADIRDCRHVTIHGCSFTGTGLVVSKSEIHIAQSSIDGVDGSWSLLGSIQAQPGIRAIDSHVVLSNADIGGGSGSVFKSPTPKAAIESKGSVVLVAAPSSLIAGRTDALLFYTAPAFQGDAATKLYVDPAIRAVSSHLSVPLVLGTDPVLLEIPSLAALVTRATNRDFVIDTELSAREGWLAALFIGLPGPRQTVHGVGDHWFDPGHAIVLLDVGATRSDWKRNHRFSLPKSLPDGTLVALQSVLLSPRRTLRLSTPLCLVLR